ncbi:MAG: hypothetical protein J1D77_06945 [Muribaculaceae bacterium]|nr:hypothetical protein [Muribaculaceae bacterium]
MKHKGWIKAFKISAWTLAGLVVAAAIALWIIVAHLQPERIAGIIEKEAGKYLDAEIKIGRLDYRLFSSYPWLDFEVDSLAIISKSLDSLSAEQLAELPQNSDSLLFIKKISAQVNVHSLIHHKVDIRNIEIERPKVNIVIYDDSLANFNISRKLPEINSVPKIDISELRIEPPLDFSFFSRPQDMEAKALMEYFLLTQTPDKGYDIGFDGEVAGRYGDFELPGSLPLKFKATVVPRLPDLLLTLNNLYLNIYNMDFSASGKIDVTKAGANMEKAELRVTIGDIFELFRQMPPQLTQYMTLPDGLEGSLPLDLGIGLLSPYRIMFMPDSTDSTGFDLPAFDFHLGIADAFLKMFPKGMKPLSADDLTVSVVGKFDPENPQGNNAEIGIRMFGEGVRINSRFFVNQMDSTNLFVKGRIMEFQSDVMETLTHFVGHPAAKLKGHLRGGMGFSALVLDYGKGGLRHIEAEGDIKSKSLDVAYSGSLMTTKNFDGEFKVHVPSYPLNDYSGTRLAFQLTTDSLSGLTNGTTLGIGRLKIDLNAADTLKGNPDPYGDLIVKAATLTAKSAGNYVMARDLDMTANGAMIASGGPTQNYRVVSPTSSGDDALIAGRVDHTPLVVEYEGGGILSTIMGMVDLDAEMKVGYAYFKSPAYLYPFTVRGLDLSTNLNRVNFFARNIDISNTGFTLSGELDGLEPFLTSYSATPLKVSADVNFTNVDINRLSWGYYGALVDQGRDSVFYVAPMQPYTKADSVCVAIPRNIEAQVSLKANSAEYMQYRFSPLSTKINVGNGAATLSQLTVGTPYCRAVVDWTYSTTNLDNIFMDLKAKVENFSFSPFYQTFPVLLEKTPEIKNFTGVLNADIDCRFQMFPNMFMDANSLRAKFDIKGSDMEFARSGKIEKITHLMLIDGDEPIKIENIGITGSFHDNLLQVNPFTVAFDDYQLQLGGVNNTSGKMYYHFALLKSPFHLPFGVSLLGNMKHPEIRLGGTHIDDYRSEMVESDQADHINANIMAYLHRGWLLFLQEAAKWEQKNK